MSKIIGRRFILCLGAAVVLAFASTQRANAQDPSLMPNYGMGTLKSGFVPDPFMKKLTAGGGVEVTILSPSKNGPVNVKMKITRAPDFKLNWTAGNLPLSFYVRSQADTTLLIHMPTGGYIADDDSGGNLNPLITLKDAPSGRYDIWVGTFGNKNAPAVLHITELPVNTPIPK